METTRSTSCLRLRSRASVPTAPRKYLVVTMVEALTDQVEGNSTPLLLEDGRAGLPVGLDDVAALPGQLVVGVDALGAEDALHGQALPAARGRALGGCVGCAAHRLGHCRAPLWSRSGGAGLVVLRARTGAAC